MRRTLSFLAILVLLAIAVAFVWRVWRHAHAAPLPDGEPQIVSAAAARPVAGTMNDEG